MKLFRFAFIVLILLAVGCKQQSVKLPVSNISGVQDTIYNNTLIWMFFEEKDNDTLIKVNKNNVISTTNWIFNIDRRLPLKLLIPEVQKLQQKREKPSMHQSEEPVHNYFSYVDTVNNKLTTILFDPVGFVTKNTDTKIDTSFYHLLAKGNDLFLNGSLINESDIRTYLNNHKDSTGLKLQLSFDKNISYQKYIHIKALTETLKKDSILVNNSEFIIE